MEFSTPKTDKSRRSISLDPGTVAALRGHRVRQAQERLAWGPAWIDAGLVFSRDDGTPIHPQQLSKAFERLGKAAGLPEIRLHDLRHSYATATLALGIPTKIVTNASAIRPSPSRAIPTSTCCRRWTSTPRRRSHGRSWAAPDFNRQGPSLAVQLVGVGKSLQRHRDEGQPLHERRQLATSKAHPDERHQRAGRGGTARHPAVLAVLGSVREFGRAVLKPLGAPGGKVETFIEVPFKFGEQTVYPDGLIRVTRGSTTWTALVEVKTGSAELQREQLECYLDVARDNGFQAVLTISNQISPTPGVHPVTVDGRKTRRVELHHLSWPSVLTTAVQQHVHRGVSDPDQAWILAELIRYLEHPKSGAFDFSDLGPAWVPIREAVAAGTLPRQRQGSSRMHLAIGPILRFLSLGLGRELGAHVHVHLNRREAFDAKLRMNRQCVGLVEDGTLSGSIGFLNECTNRRRKSPRQPRDRVRRRRHATRRKSDHAREVDSSSAPGVTRFDKTRRVGSEPAHFDKRAAFRRTRGPFSSCA